MARKGKYTNNVCGHHIKVARTEKDLNQLELATLMSEDYGLRIDQNSISTIEKGQRYVKYYEIIAFAKALEKNPLWLLYGENVPEEYLG